MKYNSKTDNISDDENSNNKFKMFNRQNQSIKIENSDGFFSNFLKNTMNKVENEKKKI